jgi:hypothetical protein
MRGGFISKVCILLVVGTIAVGSGAMMLGLIGRGIDFGFGLLDLLRSKVPAGAVTTTNTTPPGNVTCWDDLTTGATHQPDANGQC